MLDIRVRLPLGVYHAQSAQSADEPEWPPSPVRLLGALLAAAHERPAADPGPDRDLLQRLCGAPPPVVGAPDAVAVGEPVGPNQVVCLRGATRWAPLNHAKDAVSPRNLGRERAAVSKIGVAVGDCPLHFVWPHFELTRDEAERLAILCSEVTFLGTTRSPALVELSTDAPDLEMPKWTPLDGQRFAPDAVGVRVPATSTIAAFDQRHRARCSGNGGVQGSGFVPQSAIGRLVTYALRADSGGPDAVDPRWWGDAIVLALDRGHSELQPKAPAGYLLARAVRVALLGAFGERGGPDEAPAILTAREADPHCAIVPLPSVWSEHADGRVLGVAIVLPHSSRVPDLSNQRARLERGLGALVDGERRFVQIPKAGRVWLELPSPERGRRSTLRIARYREPSERWVTVTPVVHSRWRKRERYGLREQVTTDCLHAGLPEPVEVELLHGPGRCGGAWRNVAAANVPESWRMSITGQTDHVRVTFAAPVRGPILLGRSRHFGGGLCVPEISEEAE